MKTPFLRIILIFVSITAFVNLATANTEATPSTTPLTYQQINALVQSGKTDQATAEALHRLQLYPNDTDVTLLLANIYANEKNYSAANKLSKNVLDNDPKNVDASLVLAKSQAAQNDYSAALDTVNHQLKFHPNDQQLQDLKTKLEKLPKTNTPPPATASNSTTSEPATTNQPVNNNSADNQANNRKTITEKKPPTVTYEDINQQFKQGHIDKAKSLAINYLKKYPNDTDVQLLLARIYVRTENYELAKQQLYKMLAYHPAYTEARLLLIGLQLNDKEYDAALETVNDGLKVQPYNKDLMQKKAEIYYAVHQYGYSAAMLRNVLTIDPNNRKANNLLNDIIDISPRDGIGRNRVGIAQGLYNASDLHEVWDYTTLFYSRDTDYGTIITNLNYASREHESAAQGEIVAYPVINRYVYLAIDLAYANNPNLFPDYTAGAEGFFSIPRAFDFSLGAVYKNVQNSEYFTTYTGSLSKTLGNFWLSFRPYYYVPNAGSTSILYTGTIRRYFNDAGDLYVGITAGDGFSPDLNDLQSVNFIVVRDTFANLNVQFPIVNHHYVINLSAGCERYLYPSGHVRDLVGGTIGISARF